MKKETEVFKLSYKFDSGLKYVASTGSVYIARNKVVIITLFLLLAYCITSLFLPIPKPMLNLQPIIVVLAFLCTESFIISYIYAVIQLKRNRQLIVNVPCTLTLFESHLCEESPVSKAEIDYSSVKQVIVTFEAVAIVTAEMAVFIPMNCFFNKDLCEILTFMLSKGANVSGGTMTFARILDNLKNIFDDDDEE